LEVANAHGWRDLGDERTEGFASELPYLYFYAVGYLDAVGLRFGHAE